MNTDAQAIEELAEEAELAAASGAYDWGAKCLRDAIVIAERGERALSAVVLLRRLFLFDMLDETVIAKLVSWQDRLGLPPDELWRSHLHELAAVKARWQNAAANAYLATRDILFEVGETGFLSWERGAVRIAALRMPDAGCVEVGLPSDSLVTEAMAAAMLSVLLPIESRELDEGDDFDDLGEIESRAEEWSLTFVRSGRTCNVRGPSLIE